MLYNAAELVWLTVYVQIASCWYIAHINVGYGGIFDVKDGFRQAYLLP